MKTRLTISSSGKNLAVLVIEVRFNLAFSSGRSVAAETFRVCRNVPCLRVSAKQIYDRLRSSRMTDEVLLTVFAYYK